QRDDRHQRADAGAPGRCGRSEARGAAARAREDRLASMRFSHFFIDRPIFATVIAIVILIIGAVAYAGLPAAQYPEVAPPTVVVRASYPGANAETVAATVATPIEEQVNGVEDMLYMSSYSTSDGNMSLTITFRLGTDLDKAQVLVQNRVAIATPRLPDEV